MSHRLLVLRLQYIDGTLDRRQDFFVVFLQPFQALGDAFAHAPFQFVVATAGPVAAFVQRDDLPIPRIGNGLLRLRLWLWPRR